MMVMVVLMTIINGKGLPKQLVHDTVVQSEVNAGLMMLIRREEKKKRTYLRPMASVMTTDSRMLSCQPRSSRIPTVTTEKTN